MNDSEQGLDVNRLVQKFQNKLSEAITQIIILETELESKNERLAELEKNDKAVDATVE